MGDLDISKGQVIIVGSGIGSIGQLTLQAVAYIEQADIVFFVVADSVTENYIKTKNPNCVDLYKFYDDGKGRMTTYIQMSEVMLMHVRQGENVVGVFYGHPGVFVSPSHRTIDIAHREGYTAKMLPGVSAEDCLFADLNIDPSVPGCVTYEATDLLIRNKPLNPASHLIIFQVGCIGITDFNFAGFKNINFNFLLDYLELVYSPKHTVIHYVANILPFVEPTIDQYTIAELRNAETQKRITGISTFYLPPKSLLGTVEEMAVKLGLASPGKKVKMPHYPAVRFMEGHGSPANAAYEGLERSAIKEIEMHLAPQGYKPTCVSPAMADLMTKLALDPKALGEYKQDPALYIEHTPGLTPLEMRAIKLGKQGTILRVMKEGYDSTSESENQDCSVQIDVVEIADIIEAVIVIGA